MHVASPADEPVSPSAMPSSASHVGTPGVRSAKMLTRSERPTSAILTLYEPYVIHSGATSLMSSPGAVFMM